MISIGFNSPYSEEALQQISIILEDSTFVYGIFIKGTILVESNRMLLSELDIFLKKYDGLHVDYISKSRAFTHVTSDGISQIEGKTSHKDEMSEGIYCYYNGEIASEELKHFSTSIYNYFKKMNEKICFIYFGKHKMCVHINDNNRFIFYNEFEIENEADALYYLKSVIQSLNIDDEKIRIVMAGYIEEGFAIYKTIYQYFKNVEFTVDSDFRINNKDVSNHAYFDHFLCIQHH